MAHKNKITRSHTTATKAAQEIVEILRGHPEVKKISLGFIKAGLRPLKGGSPRRIKAWERDGGLHLTVRDNVTVQEMSIYVTDTEPVLRSLKSAVPDRGFSITIASQ